jgi:hypothetical protein
VVPGRLGGSVHGLLRFTTAPGREPLRVSGTWLNRTITLSELEKGTERALPNGRVFVIEFPETDGTNEITGSWTHGAEHGILSIHVALPL